MSTTARQVIGRSLSVHRSIPSIRAARKALDGSTSIGFVPTMGALHDGHLSLIKQARSQNDVVVASIFVNPTQFGEGEDFGKYPRQLEKDSELLSDLGVDHLFAPQSDTMYGPNHVTYVDPAGFDDIPEGKSRPGHFRGVATVVTKLFNIVQPTRAYFGQKDAAQCCLINRIVKDLDMDVEVMVMDTIREPDGLAMSSRNAYLSQREREAAPTIYKSLRAARDACKSKIKDGDCVAAKDIVQQVEMILRSEPLVTDIQYISVDSRETMTQISEVGQGGAVISLACQIGSVRLIDNIVI